MHECEFCRTDFLSRPQVKNPRACENCQSLRQRANEREWHERQSKFSDRYHQLRRGQRLKLIEALTKVLMECLSVGGRLLGTPLNLEKLCEVLTRFLVELGVRQINKFCDLENVGHLKRLSG
jgi:hypothetical protein